MVVVYWRVKFKVMWAFLRRNTISIPVHDNCGHFFVQWLFAAFHAKF